MATLLLTVGLPGTGKTTLARELELERGALRLTKDEWVRALFGADNPGWASDVIEGRLIELGLRALELGVDVVLDFGLWSRAERAALRHAAAEVGATAELLYRAADPVEQRRRIARRAAEAPDSTWPMSEEDLDRWAAAFDVPTPAELDGSEPIGDPPDGLTSWREWRARRWPAARS